MARKYESDVLNELKKVEERANKRIEQAFATNNRLLYDSAMNDLKNVEIQREAEYKRLNEKAETEYKATSRGMGSTTVSRT